MSRSLYDALNNNQYAVALKLCNSILQKKPNDTLTKLLRCLAHQGDGDESLALSMAMEVTGNDAGMGDDIIPLIMRLFGRAHKDYEAYGIVLSYWEKNRNSIEKSKTLVFSALLADLIPKCQLHALHVYKLTNDVSFQWLAGFCSLIQAARSETDEAKAKHYKMAELLFNKAEADPFVSPSNDMNVKNLSFWCKFHIKINCYQYEEALKLFQASEPRQLFDNNIEVACQCLCLIELGRYEEAIQLTRESIHTLLNERTSCFVALNVIMTCEMRQSFELQRYWKRISELFSYTSLEETEMPTSFAKRNMSISILEAIKLIMIHVNDKCHYNMASFFVIHKGSSINLMDLYMKTLLEFLELYCDSGAMNELHVYINLLGENEKRKVGEYALNQLLLGSESGVVCYLNCLPCLLGTKELFLKNDYTTKFFEVLNSTLIKYWKSWEQYFSMEFECSVDQPAVAIDSKSSNWRKEDAILQAVCDNLIYYTTLQNAATKKNCSNWKHNCCDLRRQGGILKILTLLDRAYLCTGNQGYILRYITLLSSISGLSYDQVRGFSQNIKLKNGQFQCFYEFLLNGVPILSPIDLTQIEKRNHRGEEKFDGDDNEIPQDNMNIHNLTHAALKYAVNEMYYLKHAIPNHISNKTLLPYDSFYNQVFNRIQSSTFFHRAALNHIGLYSGLGCTMNKDESLLAKLEKLKIRQIYRFVASKKVKLLCNTYQEEIIGKSSVYAPYFPIDRSEILKSYPNSKDSLRSLCEKWIPLFEMSINLQSRKHISATPSLSEEIRSGSMIGFSSIIKSFFTHYGDLISHYYNVIIDIVDGVKKNNLITQSTTGVAETEDKREIVIDCMEELEEVLISAVPIINALISGEEKSDNVDIYGAEFVSIIGRYCIKHFSLLANAEFTQERFSKWALGMPIDNFEGCLIDASALLTICLPIIRVILLALAYLLPKDKKKKVKSKVNLRANIKEVAINLKGKLEETTKQFQTMTTHPKEIAAAIRTCPINEYVFRDIPIPNKWIEHQESCFDNIIKERCDLIKEISKMYALEIASFF